MRKKSIILAVLAVAVLGGLCWLVLRPNEPVYQGRRLSRWLEWYDNSYRFPMDKSRLDQVKSAVREAGTNAIPLLLRLLRAHDSTLKLKLVALANKQRVIKIRFVSAETKQLRAVRALDDLGTVGRSALPELIAVYEEELSPSAQAVLAHVLRSFGPDAMPAVPALLRDISGTNLEVRTSAIIAISGVHPKAELAVPVLVKCLQDPDTYTRVFAANVLSTYGKEAKSAIPFLLPLTSDPNNDVRFEARRAIGLIDPEAAAKQPVDKPAAVK